MILIGSQAAKHYNIDLKRRVDEHEYDIIGNMDDVNLFVDKGYSKHESPIFPGKFKLTKGKVRIEFDATDNLSNQLLFEDVIGYSTTEILENIEVVIPDVQVLYLIKRAHANFAVHFEKTFHDLRILSEAALIDEFEPIDYVSGRSVIFSLCPELIAIYAARHNEAKERFGKIQERIKLNKTNEDFFRGGANLRTFEHDDVHKAVAKFPDFPMFMRCKWDLTLAKIDRDLFERLDPKMKIWMVMEESMVIGIERAGFDATKVPSSEFPRQAQKLYRQGLTKLTKDLCKGWFQDFILDNVMSLDKPDWDYLNQFEAALQAGKVRVATKGNH